LSGVVLLAVSLFCVWAGGYAFVALVVVAGLVVSGEWTAMCGYASTDRPAFWLRLVITATVMSASLGAPGEGLGIVIVGMVVAAVWGGPAFVKSGGPAPEVRNEPAPEARDGKAPEVRSGKALVVRHGPARPGHPIHDDAAPDGPDDPPNKSGEGHGGKTARLNLAFGFPYLGLAAVAVPWLRADPGVGLANTLFVMSVVWASDIGAYLFGRLIGGPKLAPAISPGKTWSGAAGGLIGAAGASLAVAACFSTDYSPLHVIGLAIVLGIIAQAGDLLESALKRHFGVKDSGRIIPGHGGLLDRLDALLAVAPAAALLAFTVGRGVVLWR
jgi:CDP-diglyceride synthetase